MHLVLFTHFALEIASTHSSRSFSELAQKKYCLAASFSVQILNPPCAREERTDRERGREIPLLSVSYNTHAA